MSPEPEVVLKWAYRYGTLFAATYDTLDEAVASAHYAADYGDEALDCIEIAAEGARRVLDRDECYALMAPLERADAEQYEAQPTAKWRLRICGPDGTWGSHDSYPDDEAAQGALEQWIALLGPDRAKLEAIKGHAL